MISEIKNNETKICKKCGRELPLSKYSKIYGKAWAVTCKDCVIDTRTKKYYETFYIQCTVDSINNYHGVVRC